MHIEQYSSLWGLLLSTFWQLCLSQPTDTWQQYVRAPNSRIVYPAQVLSSWTTGDVTNPIGLLQGDSSLPSWPVGTTANASSYTGPNTGDGVSRTYDPQNAIDGNAITFWNDATAAEYPDTLTINTPSLLSLSGITVLSNADGVPVDFNVEVLQDGTWSTTATVTGNNATLIQVPFQETISVSGVQITVTQDQDIAPEGEYTRINEIYPGLVQSGPTILARAQPSPPSWPAGTAANASSYTGPNTGDGVSRTYDPQNAIDGNTTTFWNDATIAEYPDILTITTSSLLDLSGITVLSNTDGVPTDFTVQVLQSGVWSTAATVTGNNATYILIPFQEEMMDVSGVQITVTQDQALSQGEYTRINEVYPGLVPDTGVPSIVLDFGIDVVGYPQISFAGASNNVPGIRLAFSETLTYLTDISDFSRSDNGDKITPGSDQIAVSADPYLWIDSYGCAYGDQVCADGLHGFRYVKISLAALAADAPYTQSYGEIAIKSVSLEYTAFLGTPDTFTGWFECSDEELTQFWYDAAYTNDMVIDTVGVDTSDPRDSATPSLVGRLALLDGAKRDRDPYSGDIAVSGRSLYLTHNVSEAVYNVIADLASHQRSDGWVPPASIFNYTLTLFDYPLYWVLCSYDYLLYTGNIAYVQEYYPTLQNVLNDYYPSVTDETTSLLDKDLNGASSYGDYAFLNRSGIVTYYNTLYVLALQNAASIATVVGTEQDAASWTERAQTVSTAINNYLWDSTTGAYLDSLSGPVRHAQDGNSMAIIAGVSSASQTDSILSYFYSLALPYGNPFYDNDSIGSGFSERVYAFISYFEVQARFLSGNASTALDQIRRMYGWMSANDPTVTFWEGIGTNGSMYEGGYTSAAHGWSTGVLPALTNFILGAMPTGPGFLTWSVKPIPGDVIWASGVLDTPNGPLNVSWTMQEVTRFSIVVGIPPGTSGIVSVPVNDSNSTVLLDGATVWNGEAVDGFNATFGDDYITVPVSGVSVNVTVI